MFLVAAIEHHARKLAQAVTRAVAETLSGFSNYEAGDFFGNPGPNIHGYRLDYPESPLVEREAEEEVAEASYVGIHDWQRIIPDGPPIDMRDITVGDKYCLLCGKNITFVRFHACPVVADPQTPTAGQRGESPVGDDSPTSPAGSPLCHARKPNDPPNVATFCDEQAGHDGDHRHGRSEFWPKYGSCPKCCAPYVIGKPCTTCLLGCLKAEEEPTDPSPTIASRQHQPSVRGEGSPADSDIPPSPAGERPNWRTWAAPAICDVLAEHTPDESDIGIWCTPEWADFRDPDSAVHARHFTDWQDWRDHVSDLIAERLDTAWRAKKFGDAGFETGLDMGVSMASEFFPQFRNTQK